MRNIILDVVKGTADEVFMPFTVGGGIRELSDIREILKAGADKISINTAAVKDPSLIDKAASKFGNQCIVIAIDAKRKEGGKLSWEVYINGGRTPTGIDAVDWAKKVDKLGAGEILLTSMDMDGTKDGYDIELTKTIARAVKIPIIASGGAGKIEHVYDAVVRGEADAALLASCLHYGEFKIKEIKDYLSLKGIPVRL